MRETSFIEQNKKKWDEFETILKQERRDPDKLSELFIQVTDDLSYARTFYPNRSVKVYLNNLAQKIFRNIYRNRFSGWKAFFNFWLEELPLVIYEARNEFYVSLIVFFIAMGIGVLSSAYDPEFPKFILGDGYIEMIKTNIDNGDPMAVYKSGQQMDMFLGITLNNLRVAFFTFLLGLFASIGTVGFLLYNGIMVGTFQYFFLQMNADHPGVLRESLLTIWMHGSLEIPAIIIAGAAGVSLGKGLLFPGTYTRFQAFQLSARRGLNVMLGITPVIILAAFIESFLTRYTDLPDAVRIFFILFCFAFIIGYFIVFPFVKSRSGRSAKLIEFRLPATEKRIIDFHLIKKSSEVFAETFTLYNKFLKKHWKYGMLLSATVTTIIFYLSKSYYEKGFYYAQSIFDSFKVIQNVFGLFRYDNGSASIFCTTAVTALSVFSAQFFLTRIFLKNENRKPIRFFSIRSLNSGVLIFLLFSIFFITQSSGFPFSYLAMFLVPFALNLIFIVTINSTSWMDGIILSIRYLRSGGWVRMIETYLMTALITFLFFLITGSPLLWLYFEVMSWNLPFKPETVSTILTLSMVFLIYLGLYLLIPLLVLGAGLQYFSLREVNEGTQLLSHIKQFEEGKYAR